VHVKIDNFIIIIIIISLLVGAWEDHKICGFRFISLDIQTWCKYCQLAVDITSWTDSCCELN